MQGPTQLLQLILACRRPMTWSVRIARESRRGTDITMPEASMVLDASHCVRRNGPNRGHGAKEFRLK